MKKEKKKKRRLKKGRLILLLIILFLIFYLIYKFVDIKIINITVSGNKILTDQEVIDEAELSNYPSFFKILILPTKNKLEKNNYIKKASVSKGFLSIKINIVEEKVLYIDKKSGNKVTLDNEFKDDKTLCIPELINTIPKGKLTGFKNAINKIDINTLCLMSQIKYDPNDIDEDRYLVYMDDGNIVYLTVNKFKRINRYNKYLENIGKENGILYLDYGNYFEPINN